MTTTLTKSLSPPLSRTTLLRAVGDYYSYCTIDCDSEQQDEIIIHKYLDPLAKVICGSLDPQQKGREIAAVSDLGVFIISINKKWKQNPWTMLQIELFECLPDASDPMFSPPQTES